MKLAFTRSAGAYVIRLFGERVERRRGKEVVPAPVPAGQEASGAQSLFLFILLHAQTAAGSLAFNRKAPFLSLRQGTPGTVSSGI